MKATRVWAQSEAVVNCPHCQKPILLHLEAETRAVKIEAKPESA